MKNNSITFGFLFSIALFGCKKQLNLLPTDTISPDNAFANVTDLKKGLEGAFELNAGALNAVFIGSILADEVKISNTNHGEGVVSFKWQYTPDDEGDETEFLSDFAAYYSMIDAINRELASIDNVTPENAGETTLKKRIRAELIALRGMAHFEVMIRFMSNGYDSNSLGVPIMLQSNLLGQPARAKVGEVVRQIRSDLAAGRAETAIPDAPDDLTDLSHAAIAAYQARVSLLARDWDSVIVFAGDAIRLSGKTLADTSNFAGYWADANEVETLWKYRNQLTPQLLWMDAASNLYFEPSDTLKSKFDRMNDIRFSVYFQTNVTPVDSIIIWKYPGTTGEPQVNDVVLVRVAELYLDLVEAYAQKGDLPLATDSLNNFRKTRIKNYTNIVLGNQQSAIQAVLDERFKELCFEGFRFFDLKRNALPVSRAASDVQSPDWQTLQANDHRFALPIPQHEIFANKNMLQNPGY